FHSEIKNSCNGDIIYYIESHKSHNEINGGDMSQYWFLSPAQIRSLSFGARSTYYSCLYLATVTDNRRWDRDIQLFDVVPASTYYRHKKEILEKTGLDLKDMFPGNQPKLVQNPSLYG
ncbi:hypothetical protein ACKC5Q_22965, partial [Aeromonas dhakensis]|uniref:hypothetical protein n=1 Tax=Aeromonas dhakensis TaxID=196024 RepID=UPI0038B61845